MVCITYNNYASKNHEDNETGQLVAWHLINLEVPTCITEAIQIKGTACS